MTTQQQGTMTDVFYKTLQKKDSESCMSIIYSRVQKNWNEVFFKILEEPSIVQKKMIPHINGLGFSLI